MQRNLNFSSVICTDDTAVSHEKMCNDGSWSKWYCRVISTGCFSCSEERL